MNFFVKFLKALEYIWAFAVLVAFLSLIEADSVSAQNVWQQCQDGREITRCETLDCPQGDTNQDGKCTIDDSGGRVSDVRDDEFCANPISGCGEVRYYAAQDNQSCSVRVEENDNNCDLFSITQPQPDPIQTPSPTPKPQSSFGNQNQQIVPVCSGVVVDPSSGTAPIDVLIEVKAAGRVSDISEYEFVITGPDGTSQGTINQDSSSVRQTFSKPGNYKVSASLITSSGEKSTSSACQAEVEVLEKAVGGGSQEVKGEASQLPETGGSLVLGVIILASVLSGVYFYDKYKYV